MCSGGDCSCGEKKKKKSFINLTGTCCCLLVQQSAEGPETLMNAKFTIHFFLPRGNTVKYIYPSQ